MKCPLFKNSFLFDKKKQNLFVDYLTYQRIQSQVEYYGVVLPHRNIVKPQI